MQFVLWGRRAPLATLGFSEMYFEIKCNINFVNVSIKIHKVLGFIFQLYHEIFMIFLSIGMKTNKNYLLIKIH